MRTAIRRLSLLAALGALGPAAMASAQGSATRRVVIRGDSTRQDSLFTRLVVSPMSIELMMRDLMTSKAMEETIARSMREAASGEKADPERMRVLQRSLELIARRNAGLASAIQLQCSRQPMTEPPGYMGVQFEETVVSRQNNEPAVYELGSRPTIASVTPGSPADKAGIHRGDVVLSIGGQDAHRIQLENLLKPGTRVNVRLKRAAETKSFDVLIEKRPDDYGFATCTRADDVMGSESPVIMFVPRPSTATASGAMPRTPMVRPPEVATVRTRPGYSFQFTTPGTGGMFSGIFAGATIRSLTADTRELLGVEAGILVAEAPARSLARESGLRDLDVVVAVNEAPVTSIMGFLRLVNDCEDGNCKLLIVRQHKKQTVTLRIP